MKYLLLIAILFFSINAKTQTTCQCICNNGQAIKICPKGFDKACYNFMCR